MSLNHKANKDEVAWQFELQRQQEEARLRQVYDELLKGQKFNSYTQRLVGELMALLIRKKVLTQGECFMLTQFVKTQIFTSEELIVLDKMQKKKMAEVKSKN